ncbi:2',3'-cyclic-nucleotide 2'-phosphodiesterase (5'-nucleotidase family) [Thermolongibacillus altinsuensis]|uniref:2',3'-cyclic-nucleotide 2'-phosphodiesterase (5'-nucleotidase family) n=1 Tax=Thermolongibacillus altinsuensis TaxID=575256 RepID=A0A4R1QLR0_9BACL|nr:2',3'-cyclic-nucleotide 2'-phosphodiesterase (5'-nucleotidase family) [Thermolongibacillus altinsuensis]
MKGVLPKLKEIVYIYHTNDVHSHFKHWPKIAHLLREKRKEHTQKNEHVLIFDIGDFVDRVHPITEATNGKANVHLLNDIPYDAVTIGNNEGITLPHEHLNTLYEQATFSVLVANLFYPNGERPPWLKPYVLFKLGNVRLAVIGLTVPFQKFYELLGWRVEDPFAILKEILSELKGKADVIVLLSHLGINEDEKIAQLFPEVSLILGGHTHHLLENGKMIGSTLLCGAGKFGRYVGGVKLMIDSEQKKVDKEAFVIPVSNLVGECQETKRTLRRFKQESEVILSEPIVYLPHDLALDWFAPSPFASLLAEALNEWCEGDVAMVNAGVLLEPLQKGIVTKKDLHRICPHPINPCKVYLRGSELKEVVLQANTEKMKRLEIKGFGFRGKVMGQMVYDRLQIETEILSDGSEHIRRIFVDHEPLQEQKLYAVATIDMFTFGHLYPEIYRAAKKTYYMPEMLRDLLEWKLKKLYGC